MSQQPGRAALAHPVMRRAASVGASDLRREAPILLRRDDGTLLEGVVDCDLTTDWLSNGRDHHIVQARTKKVGEKDPARQARSARD
jgi:hypothetical protein